MAVDGFDAASFETDRLAKDADAMEAMAAEEATFAKLRTPWKWAVRRRIWDMMEAEDYAEWPRPVHHRIPNFVGAEAAAMRLADLPEFQSASLVKVNPDTPQRPVRRLVLSEGKTLLTPQPRLRTGFFSTLSVDENLEPGMRVDQLTNSKGVAQHGTQVTLDAQYTVDLVVVGSTAVCPATGARVGKGEGFAELEWGILSGQGNLDPQTTLVVTTVHDCQVVSDMPAGQLTKHDVPVDVIVTPTRVLRVGQGRAPKPSGVMWDLLSPQKLSQIKVLRDLKRRIEGETGMPLPQGPDETLPPTAGRQGRSGGGRGRGRGGRGAPRRANVALALSEEERQQAYEEACRRAEALAAEAKAEKERERKQAVPLDVQAGNWLAGLVKPKVTPPEEPAAAATDGFGASFKQAAAGWTAQVERQRRMNRGEAPQPADAGGRADSAAEGGEGASDEAQRRISALEAEINALKRQQRIETIEAEISAMKRDADGAGSG